MLNLTNLSTELSLAKDTILMLIVSIYQLVLAVPMPNLISVSTLVVPLEILKMDFMAMELILVLEPFLRTLLLSSMILKFKRFGIKPGNSGVHGMISMRSLSHSDLSLWTCWMLFVLTLLVTMLVAGCKFRSEKDHGLLKSLAW